MIVGTYEMNEDIRRGHLCSRPCLELPPQWILLSLQRNLRDGASEDTPWTVRPRMIFSNFGIMNSLLILWSYKASPPKP